MRFGLLLLILLFPLISIPKGPLKVAIIDTGLNLEDVRFKSLLCDRGHVDFTGAGITDLEGHGTFVSGLVKQHARNSPYCLLIIKFYKSDAPALDNINNLVDGINWAIVQKADIVNFSGGGNTFLEEEYLAIKNNPKIIFSVAAGNEGQNLDTGNYKYYPASYSLPNIHVVGGLTYDNLLTLTTNYGQKVKYWELGDRVVSTLPNGAIGTMSGTSFSTAIHTGKLIFSLTQRK